MLKKQQGAFSSGSRYSYTPEEIERDPAIKSIIQEFLTQGTAYSILGLTFQEIIRRVTEEERIIELSNDNGESIAILSQANREAALSMDQPPEALPQYRVVGYVEGGEVGITTCPKPPRELVDVWHKLKAEKEARVKEEARVSAEEEVRAAEEARVSAEEEVRAAEEARVSAEEEVRAAEEARVSAAEEARAEVEREAATAEVEAVRMRVPQEAAQREEEIDSPLINGATSAEEADPSAAIECASNPLGVESASLGDSESVSERGAEQKVSDSGDNIPGLEGEALGPDQNPVSGLAEMLTSQGSEAQYASNAIDVVGQAPQPEDSHPAKSGYCLML